MDNSKRITYGLSAYTTNFNTNIFFLSRNSINKKNRLVKESLN